MITAPYDYYFLCPTRLLYSSIHLCEQKWTPDGDIAYERPLVGPNPLPHTSHVLGLLIIN